MFPCNLFIDFFKILFLYFQREGEGGRGEGEKQCVVVSHILPSRDLACNPGMCPDWEPNQQPPGSQAGTQFTEPHQPGHVSL